MGGYKLSKRFEIIEEDGIFQGTKIIVDTQTGVQYLLAFCGEMSGLTLVVDKDGKPLLDERYVN